MATRYVPGRQSRMSHCGEAVGARMLSSRSCEAASPDPGPLAKWVVLAVGGLLALESSWE